MARAIMLQSQFAAGLLDATDLPPYRRCFPYLSTSLLRKICPTIIFWFLDRCTPRIDRWIGSTMTHTHASKCSTLAYVASTRLAWDPLHVEYSMRLESPD